MPFVWEAFNSEQMWKLFKEVDEEDEEKGR
jgi:hypothetical protein